jgi:hypothetical protein
MLVHPRKTGDMLYYYDDHDASYEDDLSVGSLVSWHSTYTNHLDREIDAYVAAETPEERAAALDSVAKRLDPNTSSRVAAIAELQRRGILNTPGPRLTTAQTASMGGPDKTGWTGCERGYLARVTASGNTAFYAVVASSQESALAAVHQVIRPGERAEITDSMLSPDRARALGLRFGIAAEVTADLRRKRPLTQKYRADKQ